MHLPAVYSPIMGFGAGDVAAAPVFVTPDRSAQHRPVADISSPLRNFLDIALAGFHYSAIGHVVTLGRFLGSAGLHPLNDEVTASTCHEGAAISGIRIDAE